MRAAGATTVQAPKAMGLRRHIAPPDNLAGTQTTAGTGI